MRAFGIRSPAVRPLRLARVLAVLLVLGVSVGCGGATEPAAARTRAPAALPVSPTLDPGPGHVMSPEERAYAVTLLGLTNQERARESLPPLLWDERAAQAAIDHAVYQQWRGHLQHEGSGANDAGARLEAVGIEWRAWAENVAVGHEDPAEAVSDWLASPPHRANLLAPALTHVGIGVRLGAGGIYSGPWITQDLYAR